MYVSLTESGLLWGGRYGGGFNLFCSVSISDPRRLRFPSSLALWLPARAANGRACRENGGWEEGRSQSVCSSLFVLNRDVGSKCVSSMVAPVISTPPSLLLVPGGKHLPASADLWVASPTLFFSLASQQFPLLNPLWVKYWEWLLLSQWTLSNREEILSLWGLLLTGWGILLSGLRFKTQQDTFLEG